MYPQSVCRKRWSQCVYIQYTESNSDIVSTVNMQKVINEGPQLTFFFLVSSSTQPMEWYYLNLG